MLKNLLARLREPSSQAGIAALATLATVAGVPQTTAQAVAQAVVAVSSLLAVFIPEGKANVPSVE